MPLAEAPSKIWAQRLVANDKTPKVLQPDKNSRSSSVAVSLQLASILSRLLSVSTMWGNDFNAVEAQLRVKTIRVMALSPIKFWGGSAITLCNKVEVASITLYGVALSMPTETGRPLRSATAMIFVPLPRFFFPTLCPLFSRREGRVDEGLTHIEQ